MQGMASLHPLRICMPVHFSKRQLSNTSTYTIQKVLSNAGVEEIFYVIPKS